jgi:hypothetical protein
LPQTQDQKLSDSQRKRIEQAFRGTRAPCGSAVGDYRFSNKGKTTTFKLLKDDCKARRVAMSHPWTRR